MKYDYGHPEQGYSFEHCNFYDCLRRMGHDVIYFDFMTELAERGREEMNRRLLETAKGEQPDLMFTVLYRDELDRAVVRTISEETDTVTVNWFCDDHWRFEAFSRHWAPCFNWVVTTDRDALPKYADIGYDNVILSQWACNHFLYRKLDLPLKYDITFVGQPDDHRREVITGLRDAGLDVRAWGNGWESGRLTQDEMIAVFNQSRINLNLTRSRLPVLRAERAACPLLRWGANAVRLLPQGERLVERVKRRLWSKEGPNEGPLHYREQIKGRNFEVPGCGGFMVTGTADYLDEYYVPDQEVVCFTGIEELIAKAKYYLEHEEERAQIARAGYERTLREHTYVHRFTGIFRRMGIAGVA